MRQFIGLAALAATGSIALAGGTITSSGGAKYIGVGTFASASTGDGTFNTVGSTVDQLFKNSWYYRSNTTNRQFSSLVSPTEVWSGNTATITWTDNGDGATGGNRFDAVLTMVIDDAGNGTGRVTSTMVFTARSQNTSTRTFSIFNLVDLDLLGGSPNPSLDDTYTYAGGGIVNVTEGSTSNTGQVRGVGATNWEINSGLNLRNKLNSGSSNLANTSSTFTGDGAAAFQWTVSLAPGASTTVVSSFAINMQALPTPGATALLGLAGLIAGRRRRA